MLPDNGQRYVMYTRKGMVRGLFKGVKREGRVAEMETKEGRDGYLG